MKRLILAGLITPGLLAGGAYAHDSYSVSHYCTKPTKPYEFTSQRQVDRFQRDVETYQACIQGFVDEQNAAAQNHGQAAGEAIDEWNDFADYELN